MSSIELLKIFGARMKSLRGDQTLSAFSKALGISPQRLYNYESGRNLPNASTAKNIAEKCGVTTIWLLTGSTGEEGRRAVFDMRGDLASLYVFNLFLRDWLANPSKRTFLEGGLKEICGAEKGVQIINMLKGFNDL